MSKLLRAKFLKGRSAAIKESIRSLIFLFVVAMLSLLIVSLFEFAFSP